ncbi:MAG: allophanate hydrolase [Verrucomicrobiales bacterium]|jgi:allophanate hydrolase
MNPSLTINELRRAYAVGTVTVDEVLDYVMAQADAADPVIWIHRLTREELQVYADRPTRNGDLPLYGIPFAIKDNIDLAGVPTTAACPEYAYTPSESATVVRRLIDAGAIPIGKTNLDQFATGLVGVRSPYGVSGNAFDADYTPGGSSAGSAIAAAKGLVSFSQGTDTAGSGRVPAAFNNLVGLKPSCGRLSNFGVVPACRTLDCVSIFANTAADAEAVLKQAEGLDAKDAYSRQVPNALPPALRMPRVAIPRPEDLKFFGNAAYERAFKDACEAMKQLGWTVTEIDFSPFLETARLLYEGPWVAERYTAIRDFITAKPEALHPVTLAIIGKGADLGADETFEAMYRLEALRVQMAKTWTDYDIIVTPTAGTTYRIDEVEADPIQTNSNLGYYTNHMNLLDLSAVAVPARMLDNGMPFGITLSAPAWHDERLLDFAERFHQAVAPRSCRIAVCGAHLEGLPLHHQLTELGATFVECTNTASSYRLFALPKTAPPKPGLIRDETDKGGPIEIEIYALTPENFGKFVHQIPSPLGIGKIETASGQYVSGFLCESFALSGA